MQTYELHAIAYLLNPVDPEDVLRCGITNIIQHTDGHYSYEVWTENQKTYTVTAEDLYPTLIEARIAARTHRESAFTEL